MLLRARSHPGLILGGSFVVLVVLAAGCAPGLAPYGPYDQDLMNRLADPAWSPRGSWAHPLGTDGLGRDILSRLLYGAQVSVGIGLAAAILAGIIGSALGIAGG